MSKELGNAIMVEVVRAYIEELPVDNQVDLHEAYEEIYDFCVDCGITADKLIKIEWSIKEGLEPKAYWIVKFICIGTHPDLKGYNE